MSTDSYDRDEDRRHGDDQHEEKTPAKRYWRFAAMVLSGTVVMYATMYAGTWEWSHVRFSESRVFMALTRVRSAGFAAGTRTLNRSPNTGRSAVRIISQSLPCTFAVPRAPPVASP